jgi:LysR family transcriptional regulator, cyn operon transcriptional activator
MELRHLQYFLAIASAESFTKASETLHLSQPSLSVQIRDLKVELGTRLLDWLGRKVMLTQAGELFRDRAQRAIHELEQAS